MSDTKRFQIDGSILEGGGQILRISAALSAILGVSVKVSNIRANRSSPGLRAQHLTGLQFVRDLTRGELTGGSIHSKEIELVPHSIDGGYFKFDVKTAGSITLLMQCCLPVCLYGKTPTRTELIGGTDVSFAPPIDYTTYVFRKTAKKFGMDFDCSLLHRGFFPRGGGKVIVNVNPLEEPLKAISLTARGKITSLKIVAFSAGRVPLSFANEMKTAAAKVLRDSLGDKLNTIQNDIAAYHEPNKMARDNGATLHIFLETDEGCVFGSNRIKDKNTPACTLGEEAAKELIEVLETDACVDQHMQDQVIILMALAKGKSSVRTSPLTMHTRTAIHLVEQMTSVTFSVREMGNSALLECEGLGLVNQNIKVDK